MKLRIFVSMREGDTPSHAQLGDATPLSTGYRTWLLHDGGAILPGVADAVQSGRIVSAYVSEREMPLERPWLAAEWHGRIVADHEVAWDLKNLLGGWSAEYLEGQGVVIFSPRSETRAGTDKSRSSTLVTSSEPSWWEIDLEDAERDPIGWFGEFGREDVGGWVTLLSAAVRREQGRGVVGNLAALGLRLNRDAESLWQVRASGAVRVAALGMRREQAEAGEFEAFGPNHPKFDLSPLEASPAGYCIAVRIDAPIDPKVIIGSGTVFEQLGPAKAQNLAVANEWHQTIDEGQIVATVLPAWCLNQDLPAPSGESLRLTPLAFVGPSTDQSSVWDDIGRRRSGAGRR